MAGKKQAKKAGAKKAAKKATKKAGAKKAAAKKPNPKRAAGKKKAGGKPARARLAMAKPPAKGEMLEVVSVEETDYSAADKAEKLGKHWERKWAKVIAKTWTDPAFKAQLLESPARTLAAEGMPLLHDVDIRIVSGEGRFTMEIPLPDRPGDLEGEVIDDLLGDLLDGKFKPKKCVMSSCCC
jgi:hypothetical protein